MRRPWSQVWGSNGTARALSTHPVLGHPAYWPVRRPGPTPRPWRSLVGSPAMCQNMATNCTLSATTMPRPHGMPKSTGVKCQLGSLLV
jgi:hypothetical protein